ncbi:MAG: HD domain-containing protein [Candidatus Micrarchaeota archaeon]
MDSTESIANYLFEVGELKRIKRSGWWLAKVKDPESVADHSHRTSVLTFILAKMEKLDPYKLCVAAVFHDVVETRLADLHKVSARYIDVTKQIEEKVISEQLESLPSEISAEMRKVYSLSSREAELLKDADYLECAIQAKEYLEIGHQNCSTWLANIEKRLKTSSAKKIFEKIKKQNSNDWYAKLKKIE